MSIDLTQQPLSVTAVNAQQDLRMRPRTGDVSSKPIESDDNSGTQVKLSKLPQQMQTDSSRDIDFDRIAKIRAAMDAGELQIDTDKIASALVNDIFQFS